MRHKKLANVERAEGGIRLRDFSGEAIDTSSFSLKIFRAHSKETRGAEKGVVVYMPEQEYQRYFN